VITKSYTERIEQPIDLYCSSDRHFWHADYDKAWPVSARVGNVKNNDPGLIEPIAVA
jgi:hypothetical protein